MIVRVIGLEVVFTDGAMELALKLAVAPCGRPVTPAGEKYTVPGKLKMLETISRGTDFSVAGRPR